MKLTLAVILQCKNAIEEESKIISGMERVKLSKQV